MDWSDKNNTRENVVSQWGARIFACLVCVGMFFSFSVTAAEEAAWVDTTSADFAKGVFDRTTIKGSDANASVHLAERAFAWQSVTAPADVTLTGIAAIAADRAWAVGGQGTFLQWDGVAWKTVEIPTANTLWAVAAIAADRAWAVGDAGTILQWDGSAWKLQAGPTTQHLLGVAALVPDDAWAVGEAGIILRWNGTSWKSIASPAREHLYALSMRSAMDGWIVGGGGTILRWDGTSWKSVASPTTNTLLGIDVFDATNAIAVGEGGIILHWNGGRWSVIASPVTETLQTVSLQSATAGWIGGENGTLLAMENGSIWKTEVSPTADAILRMEFVDSSLGWAVGTRGTLLQLRKEYAQEGTFTSDLYDTGGKVTAVRIAWDATTPSATSMQLQFAANDDNATWDYTGPDGTAQSFYTEGLTLDASRYQHRYLRYRVSLKTTNIQSTPSLHAVRVQYTVERGSPPSAPTTVTPADGVTVIALPVTFVWNPSANAASYEIQIDTTPAFASLFAKETVAETSFPLPKALDDGTYVWRVRAQNTVGQSAWSALQLFTVDRTPPAVPTKLSPDNAAIVPDTTPSFAWDAVADADRYEFQLNTIEKFLWPLLSKTVEESSYTPATALTPKTYYWRIRSRDAAGNRSVWTATRTITVVLAPETPPPVVVEPFSAVTPSFPSENGTTGGGGSPIVEEASFPLTLTPTVFATSHPVLSGIIPRSSVTAAVQIDGQIIGTTSVSSAGAFAMAVPIRLLDGSHTAAFVVNGIASSPVSFTVDTTPPPFPSIVVDIVWQKPSLVALDTADLLLSVAGTVDADVADVIVTDTSTTESLGSTIPFGGVLRMSVERHAQQHGTAYILIALRDSAGNIAYFPRSYDVTSGVISHACSDRQDNDSDGFTDYLHDPDCYSLTDDSEQGTFLSFVLASPTVTGVTSAILQTTATTVHTTKEVSKKVVKKTVEQTVIVAEEVDRVVQKTASVAVPTLTVVAPAAIAVNPIATANFPMLPNIFGHAISWLFSALGIRKKRKNPWGMVYDAITKEPIGLAILRLFDATTKQLLATQVTDKEGRFEFLVKPGQYRLEVQKTPFAFPSKIVEGNGDGDLLDVYHGESITVATEGQAMHMNIPIDPENTTLPRTASFRNTFDRIRRVASKASLPLLVAGTGVSIVLYAFSQTRYNLLTLLVYVGFAAYQTILSPKKLKSWGTIFDAMTLEPVPLAIVSIIDPQYQRVIKTRLSDYQGRFTFLPEPGDYQLKITKQQYQFPSKAESVGKKYHHLYHGESLSIEKKKAIIAVDVPLDPVTTATPLVTPPTPLTPIEQQSPVPPSAIPPSSPSITLPS